VSGGRLSPGLSPGTPVRWAGRDWVVSDEAMGGTPAERRDLVILERRDDRLPVFTGVCVPRDELHPMDLLDVLAEDDEKDHGSSD